MEKKGIIKQWLSFLLAFLLGIQGGLPTLSIFATSGNASVVTGRSTTTSTFNMEWTSPIDGTSLTYSADKQTCILTPKSNAYFTNIVAPESGTSAQCTLNFSLGGNKQAEVGEIQIRMPRYVFENRDGVPQGDINLGISNKQEGTTGFYYYVDTKEDEDLKNDEIVITNFKAIDSAYVFTCAVRYFTTGGGKYLSEIKDQYTKTFHATLNVQLAGEEKRVLDSNSLTIQHRTSADLSSLYKYYDNKYEKWQTSWGAMPKDSKESDYFYVVWYVRSHSSGTQPFTLTLNDTLQDTYGGQIIGCGSSSSSIKLGDEGKKAFQIDKKIPSGSWDYWYVLVKYPRTIVDPLPAQMPVLSNKGEVTLTGVDGVTVTKSATANYTYVDDSFKAPGTTYSQSKSGPSTSYGYLDKLDLTKDGEVIPNNRSYNWYISTNVKGYAWTLQEGGDKKDPTHYGKQPYEIEVIDDIVMLEGERLEKEDYQFRSFYIDSFYEYDYIQNEATGKWETKSNTKYEEWFPITIYYQSGQGSEWKPMVTLYRDNTGYYYELDTKEKVYVTSSKQFQLPSDTTGVKAIHQSKSHSSSFTLLFKIDLKKSERIKRLREGKDSIRIYNASSLRIYDAAHNCVNKRNDITATTSSYYPGLYNEVKKQDDTLYGAGNYPYHTQDYTNLTPYQRSSTMTKKVDATANNVVQGRVEIKYNINMKQSIYSSVETAKELREVGVFQEEKEGVFYDLLPRGMFVDKGSIKIHRQRSWYDAPYNSYYDKEYGAIVSVDWKENWKNTGRTMMIVHMKVPDGKNNYYEDGNSLYSGWHLWYTAYYPWESVVDYGNTLNNSVAYKSPQGPLFGGYPDDGGTIVDKADMVDLDEDGNPQGTLKDTLYAEKKDVLALDTAADLSFSKSVKASTDENYKKDTVTVGGSDYSYRLRIASQKYTETGNIILYDVLEQYDPTNTNRWEGGLKGIDLSSPIVKGIDVKVYYATKQNVMANVEQFRDLTNTEIWSAQAPSDLSKVTALAFDLRKKTDGKDYVMMPEEAMSIVLSMKSPIIKVREYETAQAEAFNSCWYSGYTKDQVSKIVTDRWLESPSTSVKITSPKIEVVKSATPTSGTEQVPQTVEVDGQIVYNIGVVSKEDAVGFDQVEAEDIIPAGLSVDLSQLKWYIGTDEKNAELVQTSKDVAVTQDPNNPNKLTFIIKRLSPNTEVHFLVPTKVEAVKRSISFKNTASLTKIQGEPYVVTSGTTYHNAVEKRNITVKKVWEDRENKDQKRPQSVTVKLVADGVDTTQTVELSAANEWTGTFTGLYKYNGETEIQYTVKEVPVDGYQAKITGTMADGYTITNIGTITVSGTKVWEDANNQDGKRPGQITVQLYGNGTLVKSQEVTGLTSIWPYFFQDLPKYENGKEIIYTVSEVPVAGGYQSSVKDYVITNTYTPETINIPVTKVWEDANNQDGKRPEEVTITLVKNGTETQETQVLNKANGWTGAFTNLPVYEAGNKIVYEIREQEVTNYQTKITGNVETGFIVTNQHTPEQITIRGTKIWNDASNQDGKRPSEITVQLLKDGNVVKEQVLQVDNFQNMDKWEYVFTDVPKYENGKEIQYTVSEKVVPNEYTSSVDGFVITNTHIPEVMDIPIEKVWDDANNQDGKRPEDVVIHLLKNGTEEVAVQTLNEQNQWNTSFENLPVYEAGQKITYTVEEDTVTGYTKDITGDMETGFVVTNHYTPEQITVSGTKIWDDGENNDGKRPNQITIELLKNGTVIQEKVLVASDFHNNSRWEYTFTNLPKYENGKELTYTVDEKEEIAGYTKTIQGYDITNTHPLSKVQVQFDHEWNDKEDADGLRQEQVTVKLFANGIDTGKEIIISDANQWVGIFDDLLEYQEGKKIVYTIQTIPVDGYTVEILNQSMDMQNKYHIIHTHIPETIILEGKKIWVDASNQDGVRPEQITLHLYANGTQIDDIIVSGTGDVWTWNSKELIKREKGKEIVYTIQEENVVGYEINLDGYNITNSHKPKTRTITVQKIWDDDNNQDGKRPKNVEVKLYHNGVVTGQSLILMEENNWKVSFEQLPVFEAGKEIQYTVQEVEVEGYVGTMTGTMEDGYVITNRHDSEQMTIPVENIWNDGNNQYGKRPQTVSVQLLADGEKVGTEYILEDGNEWKDVFTNLPKYKNGVEIQYTIQVQDIEGYYVVVEGDMSKGFKIIDTPFTTISGTKVWDDANNQDGIRPSTITIDLYGNGKIVDHQVVSGTALNVWEWKFEDKLQFENNKEIIYTVIEHSVENYQSSVEGYNITNHYTPDKINIPVVKQWDDANNQDGVRPSSVTMKLYANGEDTGKVQVLEESNRWSGNFTDLDQYKDGVEILYTIEESYVDSYATVISGSAITGYQVINSHKPEMIVITGSSIWNDQDNQDKKRPSQVTIELYANGVLVDKKQVIGVVGGISRIRESGMESSWKEKVSWDWSFGELPKYANGQEIIYTVKQSDVTSYTTIIYGNYIQGFLIQNDYIPVVIPETPSIIPIPIPPIPVIDLPPATESKPEEPVVDIPVEEKPIEEKPVKPMEKPIDSHYHTNSNGSSQIELEKEKEQVYHGTSNGQGKVEGIQEQSEQKTQKTENKGNVLSIYQTWIPKTSDKANITIWITTILASAYVVICQLGRRIRKK